MHGSTNFCTARVFANRGLLRWVAFVGALITGLHAQTLVVDAAECGKWTLVDGASKFTPAYPDTHSQYWLWSFVRTRKSLTTAFRFKGQFPYARYASFQTYGLTQSDTLLDFQIVPDPGSVNPFQPGMDREATARDYTVWFIPPGSTQVYPNSIEIPSSTPMPTLVLRIGRTDEGKPDGGVPLPTIEAFDDRTGQAVACPTRGMPRGLIEGPGDFSQLPSAEDPIAFYRVTGTGVMPHTATSYLVAHLGDPKKGKVALLWFMLPSFPDTYHHPDIALTGNEEVRYMGLCVHDSQSTRTGACLCDDELQLRRDSQGFVTVVVGPEDSAARAAADARGYHYLSWKGIREPLLMYRQVLPHAAFPGSVALVPLYDPEVDAAAQRADAFIGAYSPTGMVCQLSDFLEDESRCSPP